MAIPANLVILPNDNLFVQQTKTYALQQLDKANTFYIYDVRSSRDVKLTRENDGSINLDNTFGMSRWHTHAPTLPEDSLGSPLRVPNVLLDNGVSVDDINRRSLFVLLKGLQSNEVVSQRDRDFASDMIGRIFTFGRYLEEAANGRNINGIKLRNGELAALRKNWETNVAPLLGDAEKAEMGYALVNPMDERPDAKRKFVFATMLRGRDGLSINKDAHKSDYVRMAQAIPFADVEALVTRIKQTRSVRVIESNENEFLGTFFEEAILSTITRDCEGDILNTNQLRGTMGWGEDPSGHKTYRGVTTSDFVIGRTPSRVRVNTRSLMAGVIPMAEQAQGRDPINDFGIIVDRFSPDSSRFACCYQDVNSYGCWIGTYSQDNSGPTPYNWMGKQDVFAIMAPQGAGNATQRAALLNPVFQTEGEYDVKKIVQRGSAWIYQHKYDAIHVEITKMVKIHIPDIIRLWSVAGSTNGRVLAIATLPNRMRETPLPMDIDEFWRNNVNASTANALVRIYTLQYEYNKVQCLENPRIAYNRLDWVTLLSVDAFHLLPGSERGILSIQDGDKAIPFDGRAINSITLLSPDDTIRLAALSPALPGGPAVNPAVAGLPFIWPQLVATGVAPPDVTPADIRLWTADMRATLLGRPGEGLVETRRAIGNYLNNMDRLAERSELADIAGVRAGRTLLRRPMNEMLLIAQGRPPVPLSLAEDQHATPDDVLGAILRLEDISNNTAPDLRDDIQAALNEAQNFQTNVNPGAFPDVALLATVRPSSDASDVTEAATLATYTNAIINTSIVELDLIGRFIATRKATIARGAGGMPLVFNARLAPQIAIDFKTRVAATDATIKTNLREPALYVDVTIAENTMKSLIRTRAIEMEFAILQQGEPLKARYGARDFILDHMPTRNRANAIKNEILIDVQALEAIETIEGEWNALNANILALEELNQAGHVIQAGQDLLSEATARRDAVAGIRDTIQRDREGLSALLEDTLLLEVNLLAVSPFVNQSGIDQRQQRADGVDPLLNPVLAAPFVVVQPAGGLPGIDAQDARDYPTKLTAAIAAAEVAEQVAVQGNNQATLDFWINRFDTTDPGNAYYKNLINVPRVSPVGVGGVTRQNIPWVDDGAALNPVDLEPVTFQDNFLRTWVDLKGLVDDAGVNAGNVAGRVAGWNADYALLERIGGPNSNSIQQYVDWIEEDKSVIRSKVVKLGDLKARVTLKLDGLLMQHALAANENTAVPVLVAAVVTTTRVAAPAGFTKLILFETQLEELSQRDLAGWTSPGLPDPTQTNPLRLFNEDGAPRTLADEQLNDSIEFATLANVYLNVDLLEAVEDPARKQVLETRHGGISFSNHLFEWQTIDKEIQSCITNLENAMADFSPVDNAPLITSLQDQERVTAVLNQDCIIRTYRLLAGQGFTPAPAGYNPVELLVADVANDGIVGEKLSTKQLEFITPFAKACGAFVDKNAIGADAVDVNVGTEWVVCSELVVVLGGVNFNDAINTARLDATFPLLNKGIVAKNALKLWALFLRVLRLVTDPEILAGPEFRFHKGQPLAGNNEARLIAGDWKGIVFTEPLRLAVIAFLKHQYPDFIGQDLDNPRLFPDRMTFVNDPTRWSRPLQTNRRGKNAQRLKKGTWGAGRANQLNSEIGAAIVDAPGLKTAVNLLQRIATADIEVLKYRRTGRDGGLVGGDSLPEYYKIDTLIWKDLLEPIQAAYMQLTAVPGDDAQLKIDGVLDPGILVGMGVVNGAGEKIRKVTTTYMYGNVLYVRKDVDGKPDFVSPEKVEFLLRSWGALGRIVYAIQEAEIAKTLNTLDIDPTDIAIVNNPDWTAGEGPEELAPGTPIVYDAVIASAIGDAFSTEDDDDQPVPPPLETMTKNGDEGDDWETWG